MGIATDSPEILRDLPALAEIDRRHVVAVDLIAAVPTRVGMDEELWSMAEKLTLEGITTRVRLAAGRRASHTEGEAIPKATCAGDLRRFFDAAHRACVFDVRLAGKSDAGADRRFRCAFVSSTVFRTPNPVAGRPVF